LSETRSDNILSKTHTSGDVTTDYIINLHWTKETTAVSKDGFNTIKYFHGFKISFDLKQGWGTYLLLRAA